MTGAAVEAVQVAAAVASPADAREGWTLRMKDLCDLTGLPRQVVHFYIQQGLLPPGRKTGRNTAFYGPSHVERLTLIRTLQHERFLPLKAIRALLDETDAAFSPAQRSFLLGVKQRLDVLGRDAPGAKAAVDADEVLLRVGVGRDDFDRMVEKGILGARTDAAGRTLIAEGDVWILQAWAEVLRLGFTDAMEIRVEDLALVQEVAQDLFNREAVLLAGRIERMAPERAAAMIERALPLVHSLLIGFHTAKIKDFFASLS